MKRLLRFELLCHFGTMLRVAVCNPTSFSNNASKFDRLGFDLCCVSETSATKVMQPIHARALAKFGIQVHWGAPVPPQRYCIDGSESIRGSSLGVCCLAKGVCLSGRIETLFLDIGKRHVG